MEERFGEFNEMVALLKSIASKVEAAPRRFLAPIKKNATWASRLQFGIARRSFSPALRQRQLQLQLIELDQTNTAAAVCAGDELPYITVPPDSRYAAVQVTYKDGTKSGVQKVMRTPP